MITEDRYILTGGLPGVLEEGELPGVLEDVVLPIEYGWDTENNGRAPPRWLVGIWNGRKLDWPAPQVGIQSGAQGDCPLLFRLDLLRPEVQHHLALTWGPRVDGRLFISGMSERARRMAGARTRDRWFSLLNNPKALAAECRAVVAVMKEKNDE